MLNVAVDFYTSCNTCPNLRKTPSLLALFKGEYTYYCSNNKKRKKEYLILDHNILPLKEFTINIPDSCPKLAKNNMNTKVEK